MKTPILLVISTNNDTESLEKTLAHIRKHTEPGTYRICLEDTGSTRREHIDYIHSIERDVSYVHFNINPVYDVGGYLHAIKTFDSPGGFFFMQDSLYPVRDGWLDRVSSVDVGVPFRQSMSIEWGKHKGFCEEHMGGTLPDELPKYLIQYNTFYASQGVAKNLVFSLDAPIPSHKEHSQGYERLLPFYFQFMGITPHFIDSTYFKKIHWSERSLRPQ